MIRRQIKKIVNLFFWHNEYMAFTKWEYVKEGEKFLVFRYLITRNFAGDDREVGAAIQV